MRHLWLGGQAWAAASGDMAHVDAQVIKEKSWLLTPGLGPQLGPRAHVLSGGAGCWRLWPSLVCLQRPKGPHRSSGIHHESFHF